MHLSTQVSDRGNQSHFAQELNHTCHVDQLAVTWKHCHPGNIDHGFDGLVDCRVLGDRAHGDLVDVVVYCAH